MQQLAASDLRALFLPAKELNSSRRILVFGSELTYQMEGPLADLDHPSKCTHILSVAQAGVEPSKVRCSPFVRHRIHCCGIDADCKELTLDSELDSETGND